jgi:hypothetical protein
MICLIKRLCEVCGSDHRVQQWRKEGKYYCNKHYKQLLRCGEILTRTKFDKNEIIIYKDYAEIVLYNINNKEKARAIIDIDKINIINTYKWGLYEKYVVTRNNKKEIIYLHRLITNCNNNEKVVDHINRNKLDNRIINLRICTSSENGKNLGIKKNNTSGVPGVWYNNKNDKWCAEIKLNYNKIWLGTYSNFDDAVEIRKQAEIKYFGKYAPIL